MDILVLNASQIRSVCTMDQAIAAAEEALIRYSEKACNIPLRPHLDVARHHGKSLYMCGDVPGAEALGVKIVAVYPDNLKLGLPSVPATMILQNSRTGQVCALLDGTCLTRLRTGAVAGAATKALARPDSSVFALFGTGGQAETQLWAALSVRPIRTVRVFDLDAARAADFAARMNARFGEQFQVVVSAVPSPIAALEGADIVTTVTTAHQPVFDGRQVRPGTHVNGVGAYTPQMQEIDEYLVTHADQVYVDTLEGAAAESGDLIVPIQRGAFCTKQITGELGELLAGKKPGRETPEEITFFETTGSAVLDLVCARQIYERALAQEVGQFISL